STWIISSLKTSPPPFWGMSGKKRRGRRLWPSRRLGRGLFCARFLQAKDDPKDHRPDCRQDSEKQIGGEDGEGFEDPSAQQSAKPVSQAGSRRRVEGDGGGFCLFRRQVPHIYQGGGDEQSRGQSLDHAGEVEPQDVRFKEIEQPTQGRDARGEQGDREGS